MSRSEKNVLVFVLVFGRKKSPRFRMQRVGILLPLPDGRGPG